MNQGPMMGAFQMLKTARTAKAPASQPARFHVPADSTTSLTASRRASALASSASLRIIASDAPARLLGRVPNCNRLISRSSRWGYRLSKTSASSSGPMGTLNGRTRNRHSTYPTPHRTIARITSRCARSSRRG